MAVRTLSIGWVTLFLFMILSPLGAQAPVPPAADSAQPASKDGRDGDGDKDKSAVLQVGSGVTPPRQLYRPNPEYSAEARRVGHEGVCVLSLVVDREGLPRDIKVTRALGLGLDEQAIAAVRQWTFSPALKNGEPVAVFINVEVAFNLYNDLPAMPFHKLFVRANRGEAKAQYELSQAFLSGRIQPKDETR